MVSKAKWRREEKTSKTEDRKIESTPSEKQRKQTAENVIFMSSVFQKKEEKEYWTKTVLKEIMAEISPNLVKEINLQIQKDEWTPKE